MTGARSNSIVASGAVLYTVKNSQIRFLLLKNATHKAWGFAKGCAKKNETLINTAIREVQEETNLALKIEDLDSGFCDYASYFLPESKEKKECILFLCKKSIVTNEFKCSDEHETHTWASLEEAVRLLDKNELKRTIIRAHQHILKY